MRFASPMQKIQDWLTQQWVIFGGRRIDSKNYDWLLGPFGNLDVINDDYIKELAFKENLIIDYENTSQGIISSINQLKLSSVERTKLSPNIIDFYEHTQNYTLSFSVKWNPFFKFFGVLLQKLFSNRLNQLNIPTNTKTSEPINSRIITLLDRKSNEIKHVFWLRTIQSTGQTIYSGIYGVCNLPCGTTCIKAIFPLPNGNATVIMKPKVGLNGELILDSSGQKFGDTGFYFLLKDTKGGYWSKYIRSFRDELIVSNSNNSLTVKQKLTLWHLRVLEFDYEIQLKK